jgi:hypothetical protein
VGGIVRGHSRVAIVSRAERRKVLCRTEVLALLLATRASSYFYYLESINLRELLKIKLSKKALTDMYWSLRVRVWLVVASVQHFVIVKRPQALIRMLMSVEFNFHIRTFNLELLVA